ncbi:hypothetical protein [Escherichia coli]|uniref:hypothetical protein n=1 Tax=Escherichia coli TaxID=562 RepID=UPI00356A00A7
MSKTNDSIPTILKANHDVRRLAYGFLASIIASIILTLPFSERVKDIIGIENYSKLTVFISLFLPLIVNWCYNKIASNKYKKLEEIAQEKIKAEFTLDDIENLSPTDKELVKQSLDRKRKYLEILKTIKKNQEGI